MKHRKSQVLRALHDLIPHQAGDFACLRARIEAWTSHSDAVSDDARRSRLCRPVLLGWLRDRVHRHGGRYLAALFVERRTGAPPEHRPMAQSLRQKYGELYVV
jgi:hypothetical protein